MLTGMVLTATLAWPASYYVSKTGNNTTGTSWATAWNECNQISWTGIRAGDTIWLDGGRDSMTYTGSIIAGKGGELGRRIFIQRSVEPGHNGTVHLRHIEIKYPYLTIDGKKRGGISLYSGSGRGIDIQVGADETELKNLRIWSDFPGDSTQVWGSLLYIWDGNVIIRDCEFYQTNAEDQIKYLAAGKKLTIEGCYFNGLKATWCADTSYAGGGYMRHADCVQFELAAQNTNIVVRRNIFTNMGVDCFMSAYLDADSVEFSYNVFTKVNDAIKLKSAKYLYLYHNVFDRCRGDLCSGTLADVQRNNIYTGRSWSGPVHINGNPEYSLWDVGTTNWVAGTGNLQADPLFVDKDDLAGPDRKLFTADDGFCLQSNSPAINAGTSVGFISDIMGRTISGNPDVGAYEYTPVAVTVRGHREFDHPVLSNDFTNPLNLSNVQRQLRAGSIRLYNLNGKVVPTAGLHKAGMYLIRPVKSNQCKKVFITK